MLVLLVALFGHVVAMRTRKLVKWEPGLKEVFIGKFSVGQYKEGSF